MNSYPSIKTPLGHCRVHICFMNMDIRLVWFGFDVFPFRFTFTYIHSYTHPSIHSLLLFVVWRFFKIVFSFLLFCFCRMVVLLFVCLFVYLFYCYLCFVFDVHFILYFIYFYFFILVAFSPHILKSFTPKYAINTIAQICKTTPTKSQTPKSPQKSQIASWL